MFEAPAMFEIPLTPAPAQSLQILLGGQECSLHLHTRAPLPAPAMIRSPRLLPTPSLGHPGSRLYLDLSVGANKVATGAVCQDRQHIIQHAQYHFRGRLFFVDTAGVENPRWEGLGSRWRLVYQAPTAAEEAGA